jgi:hypothetical protein
VEEIHTDPQGILDTVSSHIAHDQFAGLGLEIVRGYPES